MMSFIVIGKNEGWKLTKCFQSICHLIKENKLNEFEIIYVDSNSTDDSLKVAQKNEVDKIVMLNGFINAAVARNVGVQYAQGNILYFIDGDMELLPEFLPLVYNMKNGLINKFVSGNWMNFYYDHDDNFLSKEIFSKQTSDTREKTTGGLFMIHQDIWELLGGMDIRFKRSQDIDLGLRLAKKNIFLLRKKEIAANHHTISYQNNKRMWKDLFNGNDLYARSLLYRKHFLNKHMYPRLLRNDYSLICLIVFLFTLLFKVKFAIITLSFFLIVLFLRSRFNPLKFLFFLLRDIFVFIGFFIFFPKKKPYTYELYNEE